MDHTPISRDNAYLTADEARRLLDVRAQTLYAYVSRGWIRSIAQLGRRDRLYLREDLERMLARSQARNGNAAIAASAMNYGEPILGTTITEITAEGPSYRGRPAAQLARTGASFEAVAELLWSGLWHEDDHRWPIDAKPPEVRRVTNLITPLRSNDQLLEVFALVTLTLGVSRGSIAERVRSGRIVESGRQLLQTLTGCLGYISRHRRYVPMRAGQSIVEGLIGSLDLPDSEENRDALRTFLILFVDHELSPGAFVARVAASSGATLHSCIAAAYCTISGVEIGRLYDRVEELFSVGSTKEALLAHTRWLTENRMAVPGFGHPVYPNGDPRGRRLMELIQGRARQSKRLQAIYGFIDDADTQLGLKPRHELAAVAMSLAMGLPKHTAGSLFALARTAGLIAHIQEQRLTRALLRPRARFMSD